MLGNDVRQLLRDYPKIFYACHTGHVRDPRTQRLVSAHQARILDHLDAREPTSLTNLARHMGVTASTMCIGIDRLLRAGYVLRSRDSRDQRRLLLRLSRAGVRVRDANSVLDPERVRAMLARLAPREREEALHGLQTLAEAAAGERTHSKDLGRRRQSNGPRTANRKGR